MWKLRPKEVEKLAQDCIAGEEQRRGSNAAQLQSLCAWQAKTTTPVQHTQALC